MKAPVAVVGVVAVALAVGVSGCGEPSSAAYRDAAVAALEAAASEGRTVELTARLVDGRRSPRPFASVTVHAGEQGVAAEVAWFEGLQPPSAADDATREATLHALDDLADAVAGTRIALDRDDRRGVHDGVRRVGDACDAVGELAERLS